MTAPDPPTRSRFALPALIAFGLIAAAVVWRHSSGEPPEPEFRPERYMLPQAPVIGVDSRAASDVGRRLKPDELVLGVTVGQAARAYPVSRLNAVPSRKVLNDTLGDRPLVVTWCDACFSGVVFDRKVDGRLLTFAVAGQLWHKSIVMHDEQTRSQWSQVQGRAQAGPLTGTTLEVVPSVLTDWRSWSTLHPDTTVAWFDEGGPNFTPAVYDDPARFVLAISQQGRAKAWSFTALAGGGVVNDVWEGDPVVAVLEPASKAARLYRRTVEGRVLTFTQGGGHLTDRETGTQWQPVTGEGVSGPLAGRRLTALPAVVSSRETWFSLHPRSR
ncbi:MAG: DUF3179 domain-containing (seleno)protein [Gemmataceae bacterium]